MRVTISFWEDWGWIICLEAPATNGIDYINTSDGENNNTLSLGGVIDYDDLYFNYDGNDLILESDNGIRIVFENGFNGGIAQLQIFTELMAGYDAGGNNPLLDNKVETFDFAGLLAEYDAAWLADNTITRWSLANALTQFHLGGSDTAAIGGDLAYQYATAGSLANIGLAPAQQVINDAQFGIAARQLRALSDLQVGSIRLA